MPHYTNAEEPFGLVYGVTISGENRLIFGGGSSILNAATSIAFHTAANTTTTAGTERLRIESNGHARFGSSGSASEANWSHSSYGNTEVAIDGGGGYGVLHIRGDGAGSTNTKFSMGVGDDKFYMCYDNVDTRHNITVNGSGQVGINETSPGDTLHVNGTTNLVGNSYIGGDLYMYGSSYTKGIHLGGSGSSNKLDDYEEGSWTPTANYGASGIQVYASRYTKIGNKVFIDFRGYLTGTNGNSVQVGGLPYANLASNAHNIGPVMHNGFDYSGSTEPVAVSYITGTNSYFQFYYSQTNSNGWHNVTGSETGGDQFITSLSYMAAS